jgi:uncharacterized protein (DUF1778 family)
MTKESTGELKRLNIRVRPEMHEFLKHAAESRGLTMNAMAIFALETYFQQQQILPHIGDLLERVKVDQEMKKED